MRLPPAAELRSSIATIVASARASSDRRHMAFPEGALLNEFIAPAIHDYLVSRIGMSASDATHALLSESFRSLSGIASASPARSKRHPFGKALGSKPEDIVAQWSNKAKGSVLIQSCPDLAIRYPAPFKALIEGKYFSTGTATRAAKELAESIYQSFFYLALTSIEETPTHPAWDYQYSCLIACDATPDASLVEAWQMIAPDVRAGIWDGANIYVMVLRRDA